MSKRACNVQLTDNAKKDAELDDGSFQSLKM